MTDTFTLRFRWGVNGVAELSFPQIPAKVWWGIRQFLNRTPKARLDEVALASNLKVQAAAARQYSSELKRIGILNDEGRATDLAGRWRLDNSYADAVDQIARTVYPAELVKAFPPGSTDRARVVDWFKDQGLGEGTANNKASTYLLITSPAPEIDRAKTGNGTSGRVSEPKRNAPASRNPDVASPKTAGTDSRNADMRNESAPLIPLNVNVQIHISADASGEQIDAIFAAMRKYLRDA